jgi:protein-ribulosamine 3-kinase
VTALAPLLRDGTRAAIEAAVSAHWGRPWHVRAVHSRLDEASHPAAVLAGEHGDVFVKMALGPRGMEQLTREADGLRYLATHAGVPTPTVIAVLDDPAGALVIMEAVEIVPRDDHYWRAYGRALAQIHRVKGPRFGFDTDCFWGDLYQDNTPADDWPSFFWTRRIEPRLRAAVDAGHLPADVAAQVQRLAPRLPDLCGPVVTPTLLHGDAHQNNVLATPHGPVFIDPAVYFGHPEIDLAHVDIFTPVADDLFTAYAEIMPIDPGFGRRRNLWRLPMWLAMVEVDGLQHVDGLQAILHTLL